MKLDIKPNDRFNSLMIIEEIPHIKGRHRQFRCRCDCGNEKIVDLANLRNGHTKTCGHCNEHIVKIGDKFGRWEVIGEKQRSLKSSHYEWLCKCSCEKQTIAYVDEQNLKRGLSKSCGCLTAESLSKRRFKHGENKSRLFIIWCSMRDRCYNVNNKRYDCYGGRGITICDEWNEYIPFRDWAINNGYDDTLTIDRIDVNGNYEPSNCRWATIIEQANNKRSNVLIEYNGETHTAAEWGKMLNISGREIRLWYHRGLTLEEIIIKKGAVAK